MTHLRLASPFIALLGFISCSFKAHASQQALTLPKITQNLKHWNNNQPVTLQNHQLIPIDYLEKNPHIKGLIINYYLDTGKTFLAIGFSERNPDYNVVILAPSFLKNHWLEQLKNYSITLLF